MARAVLVLAVLAAPPLRAQEDGPTLWQRAQVAQAQRQWDEAISLYAAYLRLVPRDERAWNLSGYCWLEKGDPTAAERAYRRTLALNASNAWGHFGLGRVALFRSRWDDARGHFRTVLTLDATCEPMWARYNLGFALVRLGRDTEAARYFDEALALPADQHAPALYIGALQLETRMRRLDRALHWCEVGTRRYPNSHWLWDNLGWVLDQQGQRDRARAAYERSGALVYRDTTPRHATPLGLPVRGRWLVLQGNGGEFSHRSIAGRFAWDLRGVDEAGRAFSGDGKANTDFPSWGRQVVAAAAGRVVIAEDGLADNAVGQVRPDKARGNHVAIEHARGEVTLYCHLQQGSVSVQVGEAVQAGQPIGRCGNSGYSTGPHLHFTLADASGDDAISRPAALSRYAVVRAGTTVPVPRGVPRQGEVVESAR